MQQIENAAGQIAGFGVKLWPVLQDLGQLQALYKLRWETFLGNAGLLQFFGNTDLGTLEWLSKRCGSTTIRVATDRPKTSAEGGRGLPGESWANQTVKLLEVNEAASLFGRNDPQLRQLVLWGGLPPLVLQRAHYDTHGICRDGQGGPLFDPPPGTVGPAGGPAGGGLQ
jgi:type IV secretion system protein VirD4